MIRAILSFVLCIALAASARAAGPETLLFQANLLESSGMPVLDGARNMRFAFFDASLGGTERYAQVRNSVLIDEGFFAAEIDGYGALFQTFNSLWIEVSIDLDSPPDGFQADEIYSPRHRVTNAPYASSATRAENALNAENAANAVNATNATNAVNATNATNATNASFATSAGSATTAASATNATNATNAATATFATSAASASTAAFATSAGTANSAATATNATNAQNAVLAATATNANNLGGAPRAQFLEENEQEILTVGPNGSANVWLTSVDGLPNNGAVAIYDSVSLLKGFMSVESSGGGVLNLLNPSGSNVTVDLWTNSTGGVLSFNDNSGSVKGSFGASPIDSSALLVLRGPSALAAQLGSVSGGNGFVSVYNGGGTLKAGLFVNNLSQGIVFGDSKQFIVEHPTKPNSKIVYVSLEGPEAAIFARGSIELQSGRASIEPPEHFLALAIPETLTVQLTPRAFDSLGVAAGPLAEGKIEVRELTQGSGSYRVDYNIQATRKGYENHQPVISDAEFANTYGGNSEALRDELSAHSGRASAARPRPLPPPKAE